MIKLAEWTVLTVSHLFRVHQHRNMQNSNLSVTTYPLTSWAPLTVGIDQCWFWYQLLNIPAAPSIGYFKKIVPVSSWYWVFLKTIHTIPVQDWFLAGMRQVYPWYWNWYKTGIKLVQDWDHLGSLLGCYLYPAAIASGHTSLVGSLVQVLTPLLILGTGLLYQINTGIYRPV